MAPSSKKLAAVIIIVFLAMTIAMMTIGNAVVDEQSEKHNDGKPRTPTKFVSAAGKSAHGSTSEEPGSMASQPIDSDAEAPPPLSEAPARTQALATEAPLTSVPRAVDATFEGKFPYSRAVWEALRKSLTAGPSDVVPLIITPMFHDGDVLPRMLESINVPVRHFMFVWNSNDEDIRRIVEELKRLPWGVSFAHNPDNFGFSASINHGLRLGLTMPQEDCPWYWVINCDVTFPPQTMPEMTKRAYAANLSHVGMMYGPGIDHYAFIVSRRAVEVAGLMDENFYPAYFEDVDWRWRINLAGFEEIVFNIPINHIRSHNLKKGADPRFLAMHHRHGNGWPYGAMKWGEIRQHLIHERYPPSGWKNPFGIDMPLNLWVIDPERMECLKTGRGTLHPRTGHCWYNGYKTLSPVLKNGTWFPLCMKNPYPDAFQPR